MQCKFPSISLHEKYVHVLYNVCMIFIFYKINALLTYLLITYYKLGWHNADFERESRIESKEILLKGRNV